MLPPKSRRERREPPTRRTPGCCPVPITNTTEGLTIPHSVKMPMGSPWPTVKRACRHHGDFPLDTSPGDLAPAAAGSTVWPGSAGKKKRGGGSPPPLLLLPAEAGSPPILRLAVQAAAEVRIAILLVRRDRQLEIAARTRRPCSACRSGSRPCWSRQPRDRSRESRRRRSPSRCPRLNVQNAFSRNNRLTRPSVVPGSVSAAMHRRRPARMRSGRGRARRVITCVRRRAAR